MQEIGKGLILAIITRFWQFALAGCDQNANYQQHEQQEMVTQPSGQDTDWSLYEDMEGAR